MASLNLQYKTGIKNQVTQALRAVYTSPTYPDPDLARKINIELSFPIVQERYPAIYVSFIERSIFDAGLGNYTIEFNNELEPQLFRQWLFEGDIGLNVIALDPLERDEIAASIADMLAFGHEDPLFKIFRNEIYDENFVSLQPNLSHLIPGGEENGVPAPWKNSNEFLFLTSYNIATVGSFISNQDTSQLIRISSIKSYPYLPNQPLPAGSLNPQDIGTPWIS